MTVVRIQNKNPCLSTSESISGPVGHFVAAPYGQRDSWTPYQDPTLMVNDGQLQTPVDQTCPFEMRYLRQYNLRLYLPFRMLRSEARCGVRGSRRSSWFGTKARTTASVTCPRGTESGEVTGGRGTEATSGAPGADRRAHV